METVNRKERPREPGEGENPVSVNSMEDHSGVAFPKYSLMTVEKVRKDGDSAVKGNMYRHYGPYSV